VLILLPTAFILLGVDGAVLGAALPAGLNTEADIRDGDVIGETLLRDPAELIETGSGREGFGLNGWAVAEVPNAAAARGPLGRLRSNMDQYCTCR
jgi:hypothetical protein